MLEIQCAHCGIRKMRHSGEVNRARKAGSALYCSRECAFAAKRTGKVAAGWHEQRFAARQGAVEVACTECSRPMWLPPSKVGEYKRCGSECNRAWRERTKKVVVIRGRAEPLERPCETCGTTFRPRPILVRRGQGRFCSQRCNTAAREIITSPEVLAYAQQRRREAQAAGLIDWKTGPDHHSWKGGTEAALRRRVESGKAAATLRAYRAKNPHKMREWQHRREGRKIGKLPYGTVPKIGRLQKWRCAICRASIRRGYHLDHIMPLARGGAHKPSNLQLLCGPCNLRKSDRDPVIHMQSLGRLL